MLREIDKLVEGFQDTIKKSKEQCGDRLEEIRQLTFIVRIFFKSFMESLSLDKEYRVKVGSSLALVCLTELARISGHIVFFAYNGLYRNAFGNIRYALESIVQALYIDHRHPKTPLETKIEILKEVEEKMEYRATNLIGKLEISHKRKLKGQLRREYAKLSQMIHPSHKQIIATLDDLKDEDKGVPVTIDCEEIARIHDSMRIMYDIFFFLFVDYFPELKEALKENSDAIECIKDFNLTLLSKALKVRLYKSSRKDSS